MKNINILSFIVSAIFSTQIFAQSDEDYKKEIYFSFKNTSKEVLFFEVNGQHCQDSSNKRTFYLNPNDSEKLKMTAYLCGGDTSWLRYKVFKKGNDDSIGIAEAVVYKYCSISTCRFLNTEGRSTSAAVEVQIK